MTQKEAKLSSFWCEEAEACIRIQAVDGQLPKVYLINSKLAKQYSGFGLILKDLLSIKDAIEELKLIKDNGTSTIIKQSLSFNAIITYGKCFAMANGRGVKLDKSGALKYASPEAKGEHEVIIDQRNNYVAHGGLNGYEHNPIVAILHPNMSAKVIIDIQENIMSLVDIDSQLKNFDSLVVSVIKYVQEKCKELYTKIDEDLRAQSIDELYAQSINIPLDKIIEIKIKSS